MDILLLLIIETHTNKCLSKSRYNDSQNIKNLILSKGHSIPYFNLKIILSVSRNLNLLGFGPFFPLKSTHLYHSPISLTFLWSCVCEVMGHFS